MNSPFFPDGLLANLPVAAFLCDTEGRILQFNDLAAELWQCRPSADDTSIRYCASESLSTLSGDPIPKDVGFCALAMKTGSLQAGEAIMTCKGTRDVIVRASSSPLKQDGTVIGAITVLVDVTQRFESERRLRELTNFHQSILENSAEGICVFHISEQHGFQFSLWNERMVELTGYTMSEVNKQGFCHILVSSQDQETFEQDLALIQQGTTLHNRPCHIVRRDGSARALRLSTSVLLRDPDGPTCVGMFTDVTQESQIRSDLESSQERLALAVKAAQLGLWDWNLENNAVYFSDEWGRQLGLEPQELKSEYADWAERLHPDDAPNVMEHVQAYLAGEVDTYDLEFRMRHADGSYRWLQSLATSHRDAAGKPTRILGCHLDITKSKSTEATLRHILESIVSTTGQAFFSKVVQYLQDACDAEFAMVAELRLRDSKIAQTVAVSRGNPFQYHLQDTPCQLLLEGADVCHFDDCQERFPKDAMLLDMGVDSYMGVPLADSSGTPIGLVAILRRQPFEDPAQAKTLLSVLGVRCATELERVQAEKAVRISENRLSKIASTMPSGIYIFDIQTRTTEYTNRSDVFDLGFGKGQISDFAGYFALLHDDDQELFLKFLAEWQEAEDGTILERTVRMRHANGEWRWIRFRDTTYERDAVGNVRSVIGTAEDVTSRVKARDEKIRLEQQIQQMQRAKSLGVLAGGIAHDFNNLLSSIMGFAELAQMTVKAGSEASEYIQEIIQGTRNASDLTSQMLAYAGRGKFDIQTMDVCVEVRNACRFLRVSLPTNCEFEFDLDESLPKCWGDPSQFRRVMMNLIINAKEAIREDETGRIRLATYSAQVDDPTLVSNATGEILSRGPYVVVEVSDNGCGMDEETRDRLFDPFFSTKFSGRGLGMSAVLGIIRGHKGAIQVESKVDEGTTFRIFLPATAMSPQTTKRRIDSPHTWQAQGRVLLADDEEIVRRAMSALLTKLGFEVTTAQDGHEAITIFHACPEEFDVALLDLTMPGLNGLETCRQMMEIRPQLKVVLMSGYSEESLADLPSPGPAAFLQKPFQVDTVRRLLQEVMTATTHASRSSPTTSLDESET